MSSRCLVVFDSSPDNPEAPSASEDEEEEEEEASPPPTGEGKKRKAAPTGEARGSKKGRTLLPDYTSDVEEGGEEWPSRVNPWHNRKHPVIRITYDAPPLFGIC